MTRWGAGRTVLHRQDPKHQAQAQPEPVFETALVRKHKASCLGPAHGPHSPFWTPPQLSVPRRKKATICRFDFRKAKQ